MWFDSQTGTLIGAILGSASGILGGIWGTLAGLYARKGKHKRLILASAIVLIAIGLIALGTGIAALFLKQLYHVWYPFLLIGIILVACLFPNYFNVKKIFTLAELKRMAVNDLK